MDYAVLKGVVEELNVLSLITDVEFSDNYILGDIESTIAYVFSEADIEMNEKTLKKFFTDNDIRDELSDELWNLRDYLAEKLNDEVHEILTALVDKYVSILT